MRIDASLRSLHSCPGLLHPDKFPDVVYLPHWTDIFLECELSGQFWEKGYEVVYRDVAAVMMSPERAEKWKAGGGHE